ncbi:potassium transporter TrkA, partial [Streptomyces sp. DT225]
MLGHVSSFPQQPQLSPFSGHMVVCGDDALAQRLAVELRYVYGERVTLVVPPEPGAVRPDEPLSGRGRAAALFGRMASAMNRNGGGLPHGSDGDTNAGVEAVRILQAAEPSDESLAEAGIAQA